MNTINKKKLILVIVCIVLGIFVAYQETKFIRSNEIEYTQVLVLKDDLTENTVLEEGHLRYEKYPKSIVNSEFITNPGSAIGKYIIRNIKAGTPLFNSDLTEKSAVAVPDGKVSVSFVTTLQDSVAGDIAPGSIVSIGYVSKDGIEATRLFTDVQVLKITNKNGAELNNGNVAKTANLYANQDTIPAVITVILSSEEAVTLKQYEALGRLFIMG